MEVLCTLLLNDVRYELVDTEKKFYFCILSQIKQLLHEDAQLLCAMFSFLITLSRISYLTFSEVENHLIEVFNHIEENNVIYILDAIYIVLLENLNNCTQNRNVSCCNNESSKRRPQEEIKKFLCREFNFLFEQCPKATSQLWILLLNITRISGNNEWYYLLKNIL